MRFTKMQGLGNDYVYLDCTKETPEDLPGLSRAVSDRHFGIGSDGLICICPSKRADFQMRMFNADGSEGEMCGNGIRCVGKFVHDKGLTSKAELSIETKAGVKQIRLIENKGRMGSVAVDMGEPIPASPVVLEVCGRPWRARPVSMGNPHLILFLEEIDSLNLSELGPRFENHPAFPNRTNTEFVQVLDRAHLKMRVWERGSRETLACGTGACAALAAAVLEGLCDRSAVVRLLGGELLVCLDADNHISMTGPAVTVFEGEWPDK